MQSNIMVVTGTSSIKLDDDYVDVPLKVLHSKENNE